MIKKPFIDYETNNRLKKLKANRKIFVITGSILSVIGLGIEGLGVWDYFDDSISLLGGNGTGIIAGGGIVLTGGVFAIIEAIYIGTKIRNLIQ